MKKLMTVAMGLSLMAGLLAAPAPNQGMKTPWGEKVTPENAWRGYPRPQMVRANWTNLNGEWDYAVTSVTNTPGRPEKWEGKILVPFPIESALSGVGRLPILVMVVTAAVGAALFACLWCVRANAYDE